MTPLAELLVPVVTFVIAYQLFDIYVATFATMIVSILLIIIDVLQKQPIATERWIHTTILILLSSATLFFKNSEFIKLKPTVGYIIMATTFAITPYRHGTTLLENAFANNLHLPRHTWTQLNNAWVNFFGSMSILNLIVAYNTDTHTWVYFKLFGLFGITIVFIVAQIIYLSWFKKIKSPHECNE